MKVGVFKMQPFVLEKRFNLDRHLERIKDLRCGNSFEYHKEGDGIKISGNITLNGVFCYSETEESFEKEMPVDVFVPLNKIDCMKDLALSIDDVNYNIDDSYVLFKIKCHLLGDKDDFEKFEPTKDQMFNEMLVEQILDYPKIHRKGTRREFQKDFLDSIEAMLESENSEIEIFSSVDEDSLKGYFASDFEDEEDEVIELEEEMIKFKEPEIMNDSSKSEIIEEKVEDIPIPTEIKEEPLVPEIPLPLVEEKVEIEVPKPNSIKNNPKSERTKLGLKESYSSSYVFYRVKKNDTLESIASQFKIDPLEIRRLNPTKDIKSDELLELPRR